MKQEIDNKRNIAIMYIRVIAMLFIFIDHAVTYMDIPLKSVIIQITNSGNLIFLFISGFLYGGKMINDFKRWAIKRLIRLWIPYFIFILAYFAYSHFFYEMVILQWHHSLFMFLSSKVSWGQKAARFRFGF